MNNINEIVEILSGLKEPAGYAWDIVKRGIMLEGVLEIITTTSVIGLLSYLTKMLFSHCVTTFKSYAKHSPQSSPEAAIADYHSSEKILRSGMLSIFGLSALIITSIIYLRENDAKTSFIKIFVPEYALGKMVLEHTKK